MIYFTSDTHYGHKNIAGENVSRWKDGYRKYGSTEEMDAALVKSFNIPKEDDEIWHLGDWSFGGAHNIYNFRKQIRCRNIHLILGNHDAHIENDVVLEESDFKGQVRSLFSSVQHYKELTINGQTFILFHFPINSWHHMNKGNIHLFGHCHGTNENHGKSMDVGVDVALRLFGAPRSFSITEIREIMKNK